jgi:flagellar biosynthesis protein FliQ
MNETDALEIVQSAIWTVTLMSAPLVMPAMLIGIVIAFGQALTQVQESTLTFLPKMLVVFVSIVIAGTFVGSQLQFLSERLYERIEIGFTPGF